MARKLFMALVYCMMLQIMAVNASGSECGIEAKVMTPGNISLNFMHVYNEAFTRPISEATGCKAQLTIAKSLSHLLELSKQGEHGSMLVPSAYVPYLRKLGYELLLTGPALVEILVVNKQSKINSLGDLKGQNVLIYDPLSHSTLVWRKWLRDENLPNDFANVVYGGTLDSVLWDVLEGKASSAVTIKDFLRNMPGKVMDRLRIVKSEQMKQTSAFLVKANFSSQLKTRILERMRTSKYYRWPDHKPNLLVPDKIMDAQIKARLGL